MTMHSGDESKLQSFIDTRSIGHAAVTVVSDGELRWAPQFAIPDAVSQRAMPEADTAGCIWLGLNVVLIQVAGARIVVDPALDDPGASFDRQMDVRRSLGLAAALVELGWAPEDVTHVVITHPHSDHYAGVMVERDGQLAVRFPNARHYLGRADWEGNPQRQASNSELSLRLGAVDRCGLLELVDGEQEIVPGIFLVPTPGETPGHQVVRIDSAGEQLYVLGDVYHHRCEVEHLDWAPAHADVRQLEITRRHLYAELARTGALAVAAHEQFPGWGHVIEDGQLFRWEPA
jgi:glyoxylase-like metal-dependent hydrolase (beta-lactamase superfamily II)